MNELDITSINSTSMNFNNQPSRLSCAKPDPSAGKANPGNTKPTRPPERSVPLPTKRKG